MHMQIVTKNIVGCIKNGTVGQALANEFFFNGEPVHKECVLWDYKENIGDDKLAYAELAKDVFRTYALG